MTGLTSGRLVPVVGNDAGIRQATDRDKRITTHEGK